MCKCHDLLKDIEKERTYLWFSLLWLHDIMDEDFDDDDPLIDHDRRGEAHMIEYSMLFLDQMEERITGKAFPRPTSAWYAREDMSPNTIKRAMAHSRKPFSYRFFGIE